MLSLQDREVQRDALVKVMSEQLQRMEGTCKEILGTENHWSRKDKNSGVRWGQHLVDWCWLYWWLICFWCLFWMKNKKPYVGIELIASFWLWSLCHLFKLYVNLVDFYSIVLFCLVTVGMTDRLWPYLQSLLIYHNYVSSMNALQCIHMS